MESSAKKWWLSALGFSILAGCNSYEPAPPSHSTPPAAKAAAPATPSAPSTPSAAASSPAAPAVAGKTAPAATVAPPPAAAGPSAPPPAAPKAPEMVQEKADIGATGKGQGYGVSILTTPLSIYFTVSDRIDFRIKIPEALKLYKAMEGHAPRSQAEFMEKVIKANDIPLPTLPYGHRYVYDVQREELMVEHPAP